MHDYMKLQSDQLINNKVRLQNDVVNKVTYSNGGDRWLH